MTRLGDVCAIRYGKDHKKLSDGSIPAYGSGGIIRYVDTAICENPRYSFPEKEHSVTSFTLTNLSGPLTPFFGQTSIKQKSFQSTFTISSSKRT